MKVIFILHIIGRVLNRFSKDIGFLDDLLPHTFLEYLFVSQTPIATCLCLCSVNFLSSTSAIGALHSHHWCGISCQSLRVDPFTYYLNPLPLSALVLPEDFP